MKTDLRLKMREILRGMDANQRQQMSSNLCQRLAQHSIWSNAKTVLLYAPLKDEPEIAPMLEWAWSAGKKTHLPRYETERGAYAACEIRSRQDLAVGQFGILEPGQACSVIPLNHLDLAIVPGIAFDFAGRRLGRGKGFYDRLLAEFPGHKCGVCFDPQVVSAVPEEQHDVRLDSILTPTRWHLCQRAA